MKLAPVVILALLGLVPLFTPCWTIEKPAKNGQLLESAFKRPGKVEQSG